LIGGVLHFASVTAMLITFIGKALLSSHGAMQPMINIRHVFKEIGGDEAPG
jgi:hypothetical protein